MSASQDHTSSPPFNIPDLVIRRSDLDDAETLRALVSEEEGYALDTLYNYPKILKLMETSYLSITILDDNNENIIGVMIFDAFPDIITGFNDFKHENLWEDWLYTVFDFEEAVTPYNSLWLKYGFIARGIQGMDNESEVEIVKKVFGFVYSTYPELEFLLFHLRKEALNSRETMEYIGFNLKNLFFRLHKKELSSEEKGNLNTSSEIYISPREIIINILEIRDALEQDHDDLVEVCNLQSELNTGIYGEFFIAELIAQQNETKRSIVAQIDLKAEGLLCLTTEIDYAILAKNFELETYDNLCKFEFMEAIHHRRREIEVESELAEMKRKEDLDRRMLDELRKCSIVANRMKLQQFCIVNQGEILDKMNKIKDNDKKIRTLTQKDQIEKRIEDWLNGFGITQPSDFFDEHPNEDVTLFTHIIEPKDLFLETLSYFGLHPQYIDKKGQWTNYVKNEIEKQKKKIKKDHMLSKSKGKRRQKINKNINIPDHYDFEPLIKAFKNFVSTGPEIRTKVRLQIKKEFKKIRAMFCKENGEDDPEKTQDILSIAQHLNMDLEPHQIEGFGWVLECFGGCQYVSKVIQVAEKPKKDQNELHGVNVRKRREDASKKKMIPKTIKLANYKQFQDAIDDLRIYDETLMRLKMISSPLLKTEVDEKESKKKEKWEKYCQNRRLEEIDNPYYELVKSQTEEEIMMNIPEEAKNAVCIYIFFINQTFEGRSIDFLNYAMSLFPDKDYIIVTQPYSVPETVLLQSFIPVQRKVDSNIKHVLYLYNRNNLIAPYLTLRRSIKEDMREGLYLLNGALNEGELKEHIKDGITNNASNKICFTAFNEDSVVGFFVLTKDVNLEYYKSHFWIQDHMVLNQYALTDHSRLIHSIVNPLFQRSRRFMLRELLRLADKKSLFFETHDRTILLDVFGDMIHVRRRRFPHLLDRKWDLEKDDEYLQKTRNPIPSQDKKRNPLDEESSQFALSIVTKKMLSINKENNNNRIVVVGASDTGISFIETLLSIKYINFTNIFLLAPGGTVNMHVKDKFHQLKSSSIEELKGLMLDARITIIDAKMLKFERNNKTIECKDKDGKKIIINYDILVMTLGLMDKTLDDIESTFNRQSKSTDGRDIKTSFLYSIDDPYLYKIFGHDASEGPNLGNHHPIFWLTHRKKAKDLTVYGRSLHCFTFICGMLKRGIDPSRLKMVIPPKSYEEKSTFESNSERIEYEDTKLTEPEAFEDKNIRQKVIDEVIKCGVKVYDEYSIIGCTRENPLDEEFFSLKLRNGNTKRTEDIECHMIVSSGQVDIDLNIFDTIQENGLVYNGRLIVRNNFQTTDPDIFSCGKLVEFSQRYRNFAMGKSLRLDKYSGRELGYRLAKSVTEYMGIKKKTHQNDPDYEELPQFCMPVGEGGFLPGDLIYYKIRMVAEGIPDEIIKKEENRKQIISDNLKDGKGHYIKFEFDNNGIIKGVTYLGSEEISVPSLTNLIGLSETYLNRLIERAGSALIENLTEFMSENWAMMLYHERFSVFRDMLKKKLIEKKEIDRILTDIEDLVFKKGYLDRESFKTASVHLGEELKQLMRDDAVQFIRQNMNHLPMYYVPGTEFK